MLYKTVIFLLICCSTLFGAYKEGDTLKFWSVSYIDWMKPPLPEQREITAVCKKVSEKCYIFLETNEPDTVSASTYEIFASTFDTNYYKLTRLYGPVPDALDNDPRIFILVIKPDWWGGYFDPTHQMPDTITQRIWGIRSSEKEIIFITAKYFKPSHTCVIAHEFGHLLQWGNDHSPEPPENPKIYWEDTWLDEGFSTFADSYLCSDIKRSDIVNLQPFFNLKSGVSLIKFESYSASNLFMIYLYEHFGGDSIISSLIRNQLNGIAGVQNTLQNAGYNLSFIELFRDWTIAHLLDNPDIGDGKYYYRLYNFYPPVFETTAKNYPFEFQGKLKSYSSNYIKLDSKDNSDLKILLNFDKQSKFSAVLILKNTKDNKIISISDLVADSTGCSELITNKTTAFFDEAILIVMNIDQELADDTKGNYSLTVITKELSADDSDISEYSIDINIPKNELRMNFKNFEGTDKNIELFDVRGELIYMTVTSDDLIKIDFTRFNRGMYFLRIFANGWIYHQKVILM